MWLDNYYRRLYTPNPCDGNRSLNVSALAVLHIGRIPLFVGYPTMGAIIDSIGTVAAALDRSQRKYHSMVTALVDAPLALAERHAPLDIRRDGVSSLQWKPFMLSEFKDPRGFDNHLGSDVQLRLPLYWTMARQAQNGLHNLFCMNSTIVTFLDSSHSPQLLHLCTNHSKVQSPFPIRLDPNRNPTPTAQVRGPQAGKCRAASPFGKVLPCSLWFTEVAYEVETPPNLPSSRRTHARLQPHT
jgi:hypothetical protein